MAEPENRSAEVEHTNHRYVGYEIPWYVHVLWITFWVFAVAYILIYQLPILRKEFLSPP